MAFERLPIPARRALRAAAPNVGPFGGLLEAVAETTPWEDAAAARAFFVRDLDRSLTRGVQSDADRDVARAAAREAARRDLESGAFGYGYLQPGGRARTEAAMRRRVPSTDGTTNTTGGLLRRIQRDAALQTYDAAMGFRRGG